MWWVPATRATPYEIEWSKKSVAWKNSLDVRVTLIYHYISSCDTHICICDVSNWTKTIRRRGSARSESSLSSRGRLSHQIAIKAFRCWAAFASLIRDKLKLRFHRESGSLVFIFIKHPLNVPSSLWCSLNMIIYERIFWLHQFSSIVSKLSLFTAFKAAWRSCLGNGIIVLPHFMLINNLIKGGL